VPAIAVSTTWIAGGIGNIVAGVQGLMTTGSGNSAPTTPSSMFGSRGTQMTSKTIWRGRDGTRIDVENPNPGQRPGQIHFQQGDAKYLYDPSTRTFIGAPDRVNNLLETQEVQNAIAKGLRFLGEQ
jgi:filamentous hemagglutinin